MEYTDWISVEGLDFPNECHGYYIKHSDGEAPIILKLWGMQSTLLLSVL